LFCLVCVDCEAEIGNFGAPVFKKNISEFDVAMQNLETVEKIQSGYDLAFLGSI
jgi:hypothetical protein